MAIQKLDPSTRHPFYKDHATKVRTCYDAFNGAVRTPEYVKPLSEQDQPGYEAYVSRPFYLNATERTVQGLIGTLLRTPPELSGPEPRVEGSLSFDALVQDQVMDVSLGGRILITVDVEEDGLPYLTYYPSQNIINWSDDFVMLESNRLVSSEQNPYDLIEETYWKELFIDEAGFHAARYWTKDGNNFVSTDPVRLTVRGAPVPGLQVWWVTPYDNTAILYSPPVRSVAELNVAHFRLSCDHYNGLHFLAVPTLFAQGDLQPDAMGNVTQKVVLGSTTQAAYFTAGGGLQFAEFSGSGLGAIAEEKSRIEELLTQYGARLISPKAGVETAEAVRLRAVAETSILETFTTALETGLNAALELYSLMVGTPIQVTLNREFIEAPEEQPQAQPTATATA